MPRDRPAAPACADPPAADTRLTVAALQPAPGLPPGTGRARPRRMPRAALYAGSFDPVTNGHVDVVRRAVRLVDRLVMAIGIHPGKAPLFPPEERLAMVRETCEPIAREAGCAFDCITFDDLVVE